MLTAQASGVATDFRERQEAESALRRALKLDRDNPLYLFALGQLMRKQQIYVDSRRLLDRAIDLVEKEPRSVPPADEAELWFQRGLFYEDEYLDTRHLVFAPDVPVASPCDAPVFCINFSDPKRFNDYLRHATDLSEYGEDDFEQAMQAFYRAIEADPTHATAFRRLVIHLIDRGRYMEAMGLARRYRQAAPDDPWGYVSLGLIHHRRGEDSLAELEFDRGMALSPAAIVAHYQDVSATLREAEASTYDSANDSVKQRLQEVLWRKSDPLYLTSENEVRVAHLARVAFADLMFEDPSQGVWGSLTEQGAIYVRYGPPQRTWLLHRDISKELSLLEVEEALSGGGVLVTVAQLGAGVGSFGTTVGSCRTSFFRNNCAGGMPATCSSAFRRSGRKRSAR